MLYSTPVLRVFDRPFTVADRRTRYRRPSRLVPCSQGSPVSMKHTPQHAHTRDRDARWQRIMELSGELSSKLSGDDKTAWLALEELIHAHWLDVAVENYNQGFDAGAALSWLKTLVAKRVCTREKLQALASALVEISAELQEPAPK